MFGFIMELINKQIMSLIICYLMKIYIGCSQFAVEASR